MKPSRARWVSWALAVAGRARARAGAVLTYAERTVFDSDAFADRAEAALRRRAGPRRRRAPAHRRGGRRAPRPRGAAAAPRARRAPRVVGHDPVPLARAPRPRCDAHRAAFDADRARGDRADPRRRRCCSPTRSGACGRELARAAPDAASSRRSRGVKAGSTAPCCARRARRAARVAPARSRWPPRCCWRSPRSRGRRSRRAAVLRLGVALAAVAAPSALASALAARRCVAGERRRARPPTAVAAVHRRVWLDPLRAWALARRRRRRRGRARAPRPSCARPVARSLARVRGARRGAARAARAERWRARGGWPPAPRWWRGRAAVLTAAVVALGALLLLAAARRAARAGGGPAAPAPGARAAAPRRGARGSARVPPRRRRARRGRGRARGGDARGRRPHRALQRPGGAVRPHARPGRVRRHAQLDGRRRRARLAVRRPGRRHRRRSCDDGVRALLIDTHYGFATPRGVATDLSGESKSRAKLVDRGRRARSSTTAERLRARIGYTGGGTREIFLCHAFCEVGATPRARGARRRAPRSSSRIPRRS